MTRSSAGWRGLTRNHVVALGVAAALVAAGAGCSGSSGGGERGAPVAAGPRAHGMGEEPAPGQVLDAGATTVARSPSGRVRLATLSSRASLVTGGDVLVEVRTDAGAGDPTLSVDDRPVTGLAVPDAEGRRRHLVTGLGKQSTITASVGSDAADRVAITTEDHPRTGPVFAGPKLEPFVCKNETLGLAPASDPDCTAPTVWSWRYRGADGAFHDLTDPSSPPADAATATVGGRTVPYVVREERGVIDRSIYTISVLDPQPAPAGGAGTAPAWEHDGWNGRLIHRYGGGCGSTYANNPGSGMTPAAANHDMLSRGYAVVASSLNVFQALCNSLISAEVTAMLREHFIEHYGVPEFVIGDGGSGGAIQQLQIAQTYPGLLDAITPSQTFPDSVSISGGVVDCGLMVRYRQTPEGQALTEQQWQAITGMANFGTCRLWSSTFLETMEPFGGCDPALADQVYDPVTRPTGVRCTAHDSNVNVMGRDPSTGFARRPLDNTGVEYGLAALQAGTVTVDQFLDLNERIGGFDVDGKPTADRMAADPAVISTVYQAGGVTGHDPRPLADVPIILQNAYTDELGDIHDLFRNFSVRDRLAAGGVRGNTALWASRGRTNPEQPAFVVADEWLTKAAATPADRAWSERLAAARPSLAVDTCVVDSQVVRGETVFDSGPCHDTFVPHGDPRIAAGAPRRNDILKCTLRPLDDTAIADHKVTFTPAQRERLARVFPGGVCDWTKPAEGAVPWGGPWQRL